MNKTIKQAERYEAPAMNVVELKFHRPILVGSILVGSNEDSQKVPGLWDEEEE